MQAYVASNIFWQNHDQTNARNGFAIFSANPEHGHPAEQPVLGQRRQRQHDVRATATNDLGNGFNPAALNSAAPDSQGNFVGNPAFVFPIDPRPGSDGPANLFVDANFDLTAALGRHRQRLGSRRRSRPTSSATPR